MEDITFKRLKCIIILWTLFKLISSILVIVYSQTLAVELFSQLNYNDTLIQNIVNKRGPHIDKGEHEVLLKDKLKSWVSAAGIVESKNFEN
jgi:hypothetical protein